MTALSPHFTLEELIATQHRGIDNTPPQEARDNLVRLCGLLEEVRYLVGPMHINSGYRSPELNVAVGGQPTSQHCEGLAADFIAARYSLPEIVRRIQERHLIYDQLIFELGSWIHISCAPVGRLARVEALMVGKFTNGKYEPLNLAKVG